MRVAAALIGVGAGVVSVRLALSVPWYTVGDMAARGTVLGLTAGATLLGAGLSRLRSDPADVAGYLLAAAGTSWFMTAWDDPYAPAWVFVPGRILGTAWPALLAQGLLRMFGPLTRSERTLVAAAYAGTAGAGLAATLLFNPATNGCAACPVNPLLVLDAPAVAAWLEHAAALAGPVWASLLTVALTIRLVRSTPPRRRIMLPTAACGIAVLAFVAVVYLRAIAGWHAETAGTVVWTESVLLILLSLSTGWPSLSLALTRHRLARLVVRTSAVPPIGGLGVVLGTVLHDSTARLLYPRDGGADHELIDADGEPARPRARLTPLVRGATTVAYLDHDAPLLERDTTVVAHVARLSLDHERLHAERAAQLRELRASRVRIVAAADRERRRLERDLHDGAQQRLVSLALGIRLEDITSSSGTSSDRAAILADAETEVAAALAELRTIARGLFPRELADEGLGASLETFAETDPTPVELDLQVPEGASSAVESAAFFVVAQLLATSTHTPTPGRAVRVRRSGGHLELVLHGSTRTEDLTTVEDRVGAIGGTVQRIGAGAIRIELPCAS
jgi:signal transduction histidine kinase